VTGSIGVKLQVWTTWLFYAVLIDLADAVDELAVPFDRISLEMLFRGLYHHAYSRGGLLTGFVAAPENNNLDVMKTTRKKPQP